MTDVRLTATNPADSSVVPVACNAKGELKLEEPNEFDGDLDGDLTVSGSASFAGGGCEISEYGDISLDFEAGTTGTVFVSKVGDIEKVKFLGTGSAEFEGTVTAPRLDLNGSAVNAPLYVRNNNGGEAPGIHVASGDGVPKATINNNGSADFAGGKAGITKEGHLWCKLGGRNQTVMLNNLVNGLGEWVEYVPPSRKDLVQEKLEEWSEKDKPSETDLR